MITSKVEYLLLTLIDLASRPSEGYVTSKEVAEHMGIPVKYMPQIVAALARKGWVDASRGAGGGIRLVVDPATITIQDVIDMSNNPLLIKPCVSPDFYCPRKARCPLLPVWLKTQKQIEETMSSTTLADLLRSNSAFNQQ